MRNRRAKGFALENYFLLRGIEIFRAFKLKHGTNKNIRPACHNLKF
jgi:hypothetical protein